MLATVEHLFGMGHLTDRDHEANDFLHLLPLSVPRTDAPTALPPVAVNPHPLPCDDEEDGGETVDTILLRRSELRIARTRGVYRDRRVEEYRLTRTQIGFLQVALLKVMQTAEHPERDAWFEDYKAIETGVDAAIFMAEAKLKVRHGIDIKRMGRDGGPKTRRG
jgi:hypothetical protein